MAKSHNTFVPLMVMHSMAISFVNSKDHDATNTSWPLWMKLLKEKCGVHEGWLENLRQSPIAQFRPGLHLGVIVDVSSCQWLNFTPAMLDSHVPIWYYWSNVNPNLTHPTLSLVPKDRQSTSIFRQNTRSHQQLQLMNSLPHPPHTLARHHILGSFPSQGQKSSMSGGILATVLRQTGYQAH